VLVSQSAPWFGVDWVAGLYSLYPNRAVAAVAGGNTVGRGRHGDTYVRVGLTLCAKPPRAVVDQVRAPFPFGFAALV